MLITVAPSIWRIGFEAHTLVSLSLIEPCWLLGEDAGY